MSRTFEDVKPKQLTKEQYKALSKLQDNKEFNVWREIVENGELMSAYGFLRGAALPEGVKDAESYYKGRFVMYQKMLSIVDTAEEKLTELNKNHEKGTEE